MWTDDPTEKVNAKPLVMQRMQQVSTSSQSVDNNTGESGSNSASSTNDKLLSYMVKDGAQLSDPLVTMS